MEVERSIAEAMDWYQVHHVVEGYKKQRKILRQSATEMDDVYEVYYEQNVDSGYFRAEMVATKDLGRHGAADVTLAFDIAMYTRSPPTLTEDGWFGVLELNPIAKLVVDMPGDDKLTHRAFRRIWYSLIFRRQFRQWVEEAEERLNTYINEVRNFYGLEPTLQKTERLHFEPLIGGNV
jgi:hypothetical protein